MGDILTSPQTQSLILKKTHLLNILEKKKNSFLFFLFCGVELISAIFLLYIESIFWWKDEHKNKSVKKK